MSDYDVIVIGGGPAGATVSTLLAQRGVRVALYERERFPRFHIGESLIPETYWVLQRLNMAMAWVGVSASFAKEDARLGSDRCSAPKYTPRTLTAAEFQQEYRVAAATLGIAGDPVTVYRLDCGYDWGGRLNTLIVKSPTALISPWDGAFFELVKSPTSLK